MSDDTDKTIQAASLAVTGPNTPDNVSVTKREDRLSNAMRNLAGPALCAMITFVIVILSFGTYVHIWSPLTEAARVGYVGGIGVALSLMVGVLVWRLDGSKLNHLEVKMGPGSLSMGDKDDASGNGSIKVG